MIKKINAAIIMALALALTACTSAKKSNAEKSEKISNDTWYYKAMNYDELSKYSDGDSQLIAFIDSGISPKLEEEYSDRIVYTYDIVNDSEDVFDTDTHGTEITSIACNSGNFGVCGLASKSKMLIYKVTDHHGTTKSDYLSKAIKDAVEHKATIINISIGGYKKDSNIEEAINYALANNVTVVAAAGDYGDKDLLYPAKYEGVISVQGLDSTFNLWCNSNHEDTATITFPCENIESVDISNDSTLFKSASTGTSQATALASAYIALIKDYYLDSYSKDLSNTELIDMLKEIDTFKNSNTEYLKPFVN